MSAPNKQYDPVEVTTLSAEEVSRMRDEALAAIAAARTLDELKAARLAHAGDRSPLAPANAEIGALPPEARAEAGKRVGAARREVGDALAARQAVLEAERDQRVLIEEAVDVTLPWDRQPRGRPAPGDHARRAAGRRVRRHGLRDRRGPRGRGRVVQLRRAQLPARPPGPGDAGHPVPGGPGRVGPVRRGAAHAHLAGADPGHADPAAAAVRGQPGPVLPQRRAGRHAQPGVPPDRVPGRGRGPDHGRPARRDPRVRGRDVRRGAAHPAAAGLLPVHRAVRGRVHGVPRLPRRLDPAGRRRRAGSAGPRAGSSWPAAAWSTPGC